MLMEILIKKGIVATTNGFEKRDLLIKNGVIAKIDQEIPASDSTDELIDADGLHVFPSFTDLHVHLREPGYSYKETIATGTAAAAAGGFTTVCSMPNLNPAPDNLENLRKQLDIINRDAVIEVIPFATITQKRMGHELVDFKSLAPYVAGFSDDGSGVQDEAVMKSAMKEIAKTGKILAAHCEVDSLLNGGYIHDGEYAAEHCHKGICSESEWKEVERDIRLSEETGCRLHVCHISTKESVDLIRKAKKKGIKVTCETGPHYLTFSDKDLKEEGRFKMNPPIRSEEDRDALREGIIDGTIDVIATDHAPHAENEKSKGLAKSAMGVIGLETAFAAVYTTMVKSGLISLERLLELMCFRPKEILGKDFSRGLCEGEEANITIADLTSKTKVDTKEFKTMGKATPYEGMELYGKIITTIYKGTPVK